MKKKELERRWRDAEERCDGAIADIMRAEAEAKKYREAVEAIRRALPVEPFKFISTGSGTSSATATQPGTVLFYNDGKAAS